MIKSLFKTLNKALFSPIFKCKHDFIYHCCTPQRRYCKKCQISQTFIDTWIDSDSQKAKEERNNKHIELNFKISKLNEDLEIAQQKLDKQNAESLANEDMLNADPRRIFNKHKSLKKHYKTIRQERVVEEHLREAEVQQMHKQIIAACQALR